MEQLFLRRVAKAVPGEERVSSFMHLQDFLFLLSHDYHHHHHSYLYCNIGKSEYKHIVRGTGNGMKDKGNQAKCHVTLLFNVHTQKHRTNMARQATFHCFFLSSYSLLIAP